MIEREDDQQESFNSQTIKGIHEDEETPRESESSVGISETYLKVSRLNIQNLSEIDQAK